MKSPFRPLFVPATALLLLAGCASFGHSARPTKEIMEEGFKGKESLAAHIGRGEASDADHARMAALTAELLRNQAPRGDAASWKEKTLALNQAAQDLVAHKPGALDTWKAAANCKACHTAHKPQ